MSGGVLCPGRHGCAVFKVLIKRPENGEYGIFAYLTFDYEKSDFKAGTAERQTLN